MHIWFRFNVVVLSHPVRVAPGPQRDIVPVQTAAGERAGPGIAIFFWYKYPSKVTNVHRPRMYS